ncbi:hypothetical protein DNTS_022349 [Danionella cerebrum]|uniref:Uncharacterized protein n=1 Tax=Danionella cerebrum TaxID=2873325 RepID=A0A553RCX3_9TELE|nr:hypothetical protein DNTS_022349 [Danionella translucida]
MKLILLLSTFVCLIPRVESMLVVTGTSGENLMVRFTFDSPVPNSKLVLHRNGRKQASCSETQAYCNDSEIPAVQSNGKIQEHHRGPDDMTSSTVEYGELDFTKRAHVKNVGLRPLGAPEEPDRVEYATVMFPLKKQIKLVRE